jgi:Putative prokaryotic signal transducing protein
MYAGPVTDGMQTLCTFLHRDEADIARARLASAGIPALVIADDEGGWSVGFFSDFRIRLVVRDEDVPDARDLVCDCVE